MRIYVSIKKTLKTPGLNAFLQNFWLKRFNNCKFFMTKQE